MPRLLLQFQARQQSHPLQKAEMRGKCVRDRKRFFQRKICRKCEAWRVFMSDIGAVRLHCPYPRCCSSLAGDKRVFCRTSCSLAIGNLSHMRTGKLLGIRRKNLAQIRPRSRRLLPPVQHEKNVLLLRRLSSEQDDEILQKDKQQENGRIWPMQMSNQWKLCTLSAKNVPDKVRRKVFGKVWRNGSKKSLW